MADDLCELAAGAAEICGTQVKVIVEGFLRSVSTRDDGTEIAQVVFPMDIGFSSYQAIVVPRRLVRVPPVKTTGRA